MIGIGFTPFETRADAIARLAVHAEALGLDQVESAEGWMHDATILLAEVATRTSRIGVGTSVVNTWGRSPAPARQRP
jgi:alkanesulfonate monooxygenase SsuD/methylene tetrahydromethanopterin reductase-like flavin-dependent oxidoreductase (luciferase family)